MLELKEMLTLDELVQIPKKECVIFRIIHRHRCGGKMYTQLVSIRFLYRVDIASKNGHQRQRLRAAAKAHTHIGGCAYSFYPALIMSVILTSKDTSVTVS